MIHRTRIRVGVIGMYQSGKTVLLTALVNHLVSHDPDRLPLGADHTEIGFLGITDRNFGWEAARA